MGGILLFLPRNGLLNLGGHVNSVSSQALDLKHKSIRSYEYV